MTNNIIENLNWDKMSGLIPAIIQDAFSLQVLMMGYMNKEALLKTFETKKVTFFSRSKNRLWTKGETSGHFLEMVSIQTDCDQDTLLIFAKANGPACHLKQISCFAEQNIPGLILTHLQRIIAKKYQNRPENSYTTKLFEAGLKRIAQKVGEEAVEVVLASINDTKENLISETADLFFHLLVLLRQCDVTLMDVFLELDKRRVS